MAPGNLLLASERKSATLSHWSTDTISSLFERRSDSSAEALDHLPANVRTGLAATLTACPYLVADDGISLGRTRRGKVVTGKERYTRPQGRQSRCGLDCLGTTGCRVFGGDLRS